jgi:hypothetical protein
MRIIDEPGVVIVFELDSVEDAKRYTDDFPLKKPASSPVEPGTGPPQNAHSTSSPPRATRS